MNYRIVIEYRIDEQEQKPENTERVMPTMDEVVAMIYNEQRIVPNDWNIDILHLDVDAY